MSGWYVKRDDKKYGPYSSTQLVEMAKKGQVLPLDWVARGESGQWMPASQVKGLFAVPLARTPPPLPTAPVATSQPVSAFAFDSGEEPAQDAERDSTGADRKRRTAKSLMLLNKTILAVIAGGLVVVILGIGGLWYMVSGGKSKPNYAGRGSGRKADSNSGVKVDLPDFSKVDYSFDFSKVDYTKGPQGQKLEQKNEGGRSWQQYQGPDGKILFHGKASQTVQGVKLLENLLFAGYQHGQQTEWHTNGQMKFTGVMKDGKKHGKWQHWHENGKPQKEEFFLNGVKHGPEMNWYKDGTKEFESSFVDGNEHGRHTDWWKNGKKSSEIHVKQGVRHGPATWWNKDGTVSMRLTFRDGKTSYDPSSGTVEDFGTANSCIIGGSGERRLSLQQAFDTYGKPASGFAEVANLKNETQKWVYRCTDGEAILRCTVVRNDFWKEPRMVDIWEVRKK